MQRALILLVMAALTAGLLAGCKSDEAQPASLSLEWRLANPELLRVRPDEFVQTTVVIQSDSGAGVDDLVLRFDQIEGGRLPLGVTIGTATNASSRFEQDVQVWDLGEVEAGETLVFPMTLWFGSTANTAEPLQLSLYVSAVSPDLEGLVLSNPLEIEVDTRLAARQFPNLSLCPEDGCAPNAKVRSSSDVRSQVASH